MCISLADLSCQVDIDGPLTIDALSDPTMVAASHGFTTGSVVFEKSQGSHETLFILVSIGEQVGLESRVVLPHEMPRKVEVCVEAFLSGWAVFRGVLPSYVSPEVHHS